MVVAVASGKGGTGKSTITLNLATTFSSERYRVLVIDADPQGSIARWSEMGKQQEPAVLVEPSPALFKKVTGATKQVYDVIFVDSPPTFKKRMRTVIRAADRLIIPATPGIADFWSTEMLLDMYLEEKEKRPKLDARVLISRIDRRTRAGREFRPFLEKLSIPIFLTEIPQRASYNEAWQKGLTVNRLEPNGMSAKDFQQLAKELKTWLKL